MPSPAYMSIIAVQKGEVTTGAMSEDSVGRFSKASQIDRIQVQQFECEIALPRDPQTGQPVGRRVHRGFTIHKIFDKTSPDLYAMLAKGEELRTVKIEWWRTSPAGIEEKYYEIKAERCTITGMRTYMPNCLDPSLSFMGHMEAVSIAYRRITWHHLITGTMEVDDWDN
ncbi:MAG: hypothetical protein RLY86_47 [Pseudomonadota bacterium]|jgi:type VI secretion system secreted protein Hcp